MAENTNTTNPSKISEQVSGPAPAPDILAENPFTSALNKPISIKQAAEFLASRAADQSEELLKLNRQISASSTRLYDLVSTMRMVYDANDTVVRDDWPDEAVTRHYALLSFIKTSERIVMDESNLLDQMEALRA